MSVSRLWHALRHTRRLFAGYAGEGKQVPGDGEDIGQRRLMTKVAWLYHMRDMRQHEIARRLRLSQPRVSRLLRTAEEAGIVRTVVDPPDGMFADLEDALEARYGLVAPTSTTSSTTTRTSCTATWGPRRPRSSSSCWARRKPSGCSRGAAASRPW